jgi:hypothetical protein
MNARISILVIALGVGSLALAPSLTSNQLANATGARTGWCNQQPKDEGWVSGCVSKINICIIYCDIHPDQW